jgi:hypothetical protein
MKNISDSIGELNKKSENDERGVIRGLVTAEDGSFFRSSMDNDYFQKLHKAFLKVQKMQKEEGFTWVGSLDLEDYFDKDT